MFKYSTKLILVLTFKFCLMVGIILYAGIGLGPDESQYWTWSQALDWGYYSKPPGIAWQIWLGTKLFGSTELGVRFISIILSAGQAWAVFRLARAADLQERTAFWCGVIMAFCPIGMFGSFFAITDAGFLLFWTWASVLMTDALKQAKAPSSVGIGLCILGGALFKWPMYLFWVFYFLFRHFYFSSQKLTSILTGLLISMGGLLPSFWWNMTHNWATFRHVAATVQGGHGANGGNPFEFLGAQALLLSPVLFVLLLCAFRTGFKCFQHMTAPLIFCGGVSLISLTVIFCAAFFQKMQGNWVLFAYPTGIVLLGWYCCENVKSLKWMKAGIGLSLCLVLMMFFWPVSFLFRISPFKHNLGWMQLKQALVDYGYKADKHFLVSDKYQTSSLLSFYSSGQNRAYFLNLEGARKNQFSYWPGLQEEQQGQSGYFVWVENAPYVQKKWFEKQQYYQQELSKYFEEVEFLGLVPLLLHEQMLDKGALFFKCHRCKDVQFPDTALY